MKHNDKHIMNAAAHAAARVSDRAEIGITFRDTATRLRLAELTKEWPKVGSESARAALRARLQQRYRRIYMETYVGEQVRSAWEHRHP